MTENQPVIDLDGKTTMANTSTQQAEDWIIKISDEVKQQKQSSSWEFLRWTYQSIYRVPSSLENNCYRPQKVSIGPYHHGEEHLKAMEEHKHRALLHFLSRSPEPLQSYVNALNGAVDDLMGAYDQLDDKWFNNNTRAFLKLMTTDGCFILELLRTTTAEPEELEKMDYAENDPVFSNHGKLNIVPYLKRDMLMLGNQLPMLVLTKLLAVEKGLSPTDTNISSHQQVEVTKLILKFFSQSLRDPAIRELARDCPHILDVYRRSLLRIDSDNENESEDEKTNDSQRNQSEYNIIIRSATELKEAGVRITKSETRSLKDISFQGGVLKLPHIVVDETLESEFLNLMAFERFHVGAGNEVTSYVFFMDNLIDSARDVSLLHSRGIICNELGSHKAIAELFNSPWTISKGINLNSDSNLNKVYKKISKYCRKPWPRWKASLRHNYFTSPWTLLSVIAAIFLFALAGIQTTYTVLSYLDG